MLIWIICSAPTAFVWERDYDAPGFLAAQQAEEDSPGISSPARCLKRNGRTVYVAPGRRAADTAGLLLPGEETVTETLLAPAEPESGAPGRHSPRAWRKQCLKAARERADALIEKLEKAGEDCVLIASTAVVEVLLDRLRVKGYCQARTGIFALKPLEHIQVSRRDDHCGGCGHNCLLTNPGCGMGRDKAARLGIRYHVD